MKCLFSIICIVLISCSDTQAPKTSARPDSVVAVFSESTDTSVKFLWREMRYDTLYKDSFSTIIINPDYCRTIPDAEKAALGYVATFIGNECEWDGQADGQRGNLKCKILDALQLGYQCSPEHLGFLRQWFQYDSAAINMLEHCPTVPSTATIQETFDEMYLHRKGNGIMVAFKANGINLREGKSWNWDEKDYFLIEGNHIRLVKKEKSQPNVKPNPS